MAPARVHRAEPLAYDDLVLDRPLDVQDRADERTITCPVLVHWGAGEHAMSDGMLPVWRRWARIVRGNPLPGGHFIPEEAADELTAPLRAFLSRPRQLGVERAADWP